MSYEVEGALKEQITGKRKTRQGLVCILRPNRREPRVPRARTVGSMAKSARYNDPEELILINVLRNLPRVQQELCGLISIVRYGNVAVATLKLLLAVLAAVRAFLLPLPGGAGLALALLGFTVALDEFVGAWERYFAAGGLFDLLDREC